MYGISVVHSHLAVNVDNCIVTFSLVSRVLRLLEPSVHCIVVMFHPESLKS